MNYFFDRTLAEQYHSNSQKIRIMSESWVADNIFCPCCGNPHLRKLNNNKPVADFQCDCCGALFELKCKEGKLGKKIVDGAYSTMIERITSISNPGIFIMTYSKNLSVTDMLFIPKFFFVPSIIEKRKPLAETARRAGCIGCNILIDNVPLQGKLRIIKDQQLASSDQVVQTYKHIRQLQTNNMVNRGWLFDVLNCVNKIPSADFSLKDVYLNIDELQQRHMDNHHIEAKIRQQLQILRDKGFIEFVGRGHYRKTTV